MNKFSCGCCDGDVCIGREPPQLISGLGDRLAAAMVSIYPDASQPEYSSFSLDEYAVVGKEKFKKLKQDIDEAYGMGIYSDDEYKQKLAELKTKISGI